MTKDAELYEKAMKMFRDDIAAEMGLTEKIDEMGWPAITAKECGAVGGRMGGKLGGNMVKKMIRMAQEKMEQEQNEEAP